jgi:hypothetical protein
MSVFNQNRESFLSLRLAPADTLWRCLKELRGRLRLKPDAGTSRGIHTIRMLFRRRSRRSGCNEWGNSLCRGYWAFSDLAHSDAVHQHSGIDFAGHLFFTHTDRVFTHTDRGPISYLHPERSIEHHCELDHRSEPAEQLQSEWRAV